MIILLEANLKFTVELHHMNIQNQMASKAIVDCWYVVVLVMFDLELGNLIFCFRELSEMFRVSNSNHVLGLETSFEFTKMQLYAKMQITINSTTFIIFTDCIFLLLQPKSYKSH